MSDSIKNNEYLNELIRYKNNKMSNQDMHQLERALERDPFLAEAFEGFSEFKSSDIEKDLTSIDLASGKNKIKISPKVYLSLAASIAILVVASFIFRNTSKTDQMASTEPQKESTGVLTDSIFELANVDSTLFEQQDTSNILLAEAKTQKSEPKKKERKTVQQPVQQKTKNEESNKTDVSSRQLTVAKEKSENIPSIMAAVRAEGDSSVGITNAELTRTALKKQPELDEKAETETKDNPVADSVAIDTAESNPNLGSEVSVRIGANAKPEPLGGLGLFKEYINSHLNYPASAEDKSRQVVRLRFTVATDGGLINFSIDKEPKNTDFAKEAIRLLKAGPKWAPAVKDGVPVEEEVTYRFVFKPATK